MSKIFFTSDLHFSHRNIAKFCPHTRPQGDIDTLDRYMIDVWNDTVGVDDIVYNLGDLSFSHDLKRITKVLSQLNGEHHLIFGNHDDIIQNHLDKLLNTQKHDGKPLLSSAQSYLKLKIEKQTLILFHYPIAEWDGCHKGYYHLHGHIHERMSDIQGRILNVGFDLHGRFLTLDDIQHYLDDIIESNHHFGDKTDTTLSPIYGLNIPEVLKQCTDYQSSKNDEQICANQQLLPFLIAEHFTRLNPKN
ncbi:phosphoesterase [Moraxella sp. ZY210820]|uniref:phosphoesterase n=1 Tax=unclassified Moraxella TaxID=2685852 RepID=UPI00273100D0|nr:phosphoesterase [Moraxella sp. ZY210820]WLF84533.1 phosphoesterase [Moraxella sp. ZY210820]